ncbi:DNA adenine methylase, partial [bacterium]|nr:DNA adenine methylase [bacterium]
DNPRHSDIFEDLNAKKQEDEARFESLLQALQDIFMCQDPDDILPTYKNDLDTFRQGLSPELILKVVKWFFIEQDIRYWNWSGRNMFMDGIRNI